MLEIITSMRESKLFNVNPSQLTIGCLIFHKSLKSTAIAFIVAQHGSNWNDFQNWDIILIGLHQWIEWQNYIPTRMYSSRMRTARALLYGGVSWGVGSYQTETPQTETPLDRDLALDRDPPGQRPPGQRPPWTETPQTENPLDRDPPGHVTCSSCWNTETPPVNRMTDRQV